MKHDHTKPPLTVTRVVPSDDGLHTLVTLSLSKDDAEKLVARFNEGGLAALGVIDAQVKSAEDSQRPSQWTAKTRPRPGSGGKNKNRE